MNNKVPHNKLYLTLPGKSRDDVYVEAIHGHEALNRNYQFAVDVMSADAVNLNDMIGKSATLEIEVGDEKVKLIGVVGHAETRDPTPKQEFCFRVVLEPELAMLRHSAQNQVYGTDKDVTVVDILTGELNDANKSSSNTSASRVARQIQHDMLPNAGDYPMLDFVMQYRETDANFINRLCERFGIFYSFDHSGNREKVVFGDRKEHFQKLSGQSISDKLPFRSKQQVRGVGEFGIWSFNARYETQSGTVDLREYNPATPKVSLSVTENASYESQGVVTRYGENYAKPAEGQFIAKRRVELLECQRVLFRGESNIPNLRPGVFFELSNHPIRDFEGLYIVTEVTHKCVETTPLGFSSSDLTPEPYSNEFVCVPFDKGFRPALATPKPIVTGYMIGFIDGETDGKRAELDSAGHYRIRVMCEESGLSKGRASHYVRKMEPYGGGDGYGSHSTLLVGTEVLLAFEEGDPDRPLIVGAVSNGEHTNPVTATNRNVAHRTRTASGIVMQISDGAA
ncbi:type VI secretion system secreted protein VgrG [Roseibium hamelinense]|uniref:Type VI secretion system secreted protein VgrG n=1 Tax=Roseibium hamelinense TaxID=150831 RepID=A0A562SE55_9HYPH|nr:type VI secretion system Vgr family protein [Roseibium hamelinense]MTI42560.1 type VI secretion system tip protein VgrG [Roseibium hamelinense]TWI79561.1 type VI secretion system secreted protein VgrG [Roseibium hamelinense]